MVRRFSEPDPANFSSEEEYLEEMAYYEQELSYRELMAEERYYGL